MPRDSGGMAANCIDVLRLPGAAADKPRRKEVHTGQGLLDWVQNAAEKGPQWSRGVAFISIGLLESALPTLFYL